MKVLAAQPKLVEQVHDAIVSEIAAGKLKPGERIIQEQIAQVLGVSRQPVQQEYAVHGGTGQTISNDRLEPDAGQQRTKAAQ